MAFDYIKIARSALHSIKDYRFHSVNIKQATEALNSIESSKGKISNSQLRLCDEYAVNVLGHKRFAPWLYVYVAISGNFKEGWIPDNYYGSVVVPKTNGLYRKVSSLKPLNSAIFQSGLFPDLLSHVNGIFFNNKYEYVSPEIVKDILFENHDKVIFKLDSSLQGLGIHVLNRESFSLQDVRRLGSGLFQGFIQQHEFFDEFSRDSVATIRITTVYTDSGEISARACYLRLGSGTDEYVQSKSHIRVPIDLKSGALNDIGYTPDWLEIQSHPTSKVMFSNKVIPAYKECISSVKKLHRKIPYIRCIGWDVTIDIDNKVRIMEWNSGHNDIKFSEATQGPCFSDLGWEKLPIKPS